MVRLDAVGYVIKKAGTTGFMVAPEIYEFLDWITGVATRLGLTLLPEIHASRATHDRLTASGYWTYDFVLPGLLLHSLETGDAARLASHLSSSPARQVTMLDCHDGIPIRPDLDGVLIPDEMRRLADLALERGGNINRILSPVHATGGVDVHQLNLTYFTALGEDDDRYLLARAIQLFARGIPQVYYVGLLAGSNDSPLVSQTGDGRAINRHDYSMPEIEAALRRPVVQRLLSLIRLRNQHSAFAGELTVSVSGDAVRMRWDHPDGVCDLDADLARGTCVVRATGPDGVLRDAA
jgi:sucrose phosphorylase